MKENEKKVSIRLGQDDPNETSHVPEDKNGSRERLKKPLIFALMGVVFLGCMYLIFKPSQNQKKTGDIGLNDAVPQASEAGMQADKQKAYEQEMLEEKAQEKRKALTSLSDYWNTDSTQNGQQGSPENEQGNGHSGRSGNPTLNSYREAQSTLGSFYREDNAETQQLRKQLEELKEKLAEKDIPAGITAQDQLALMEKSYQMAAKYLPGTANGTKAEGNESAGSASANRQKEYFVAVTPVRNNAVSALRRGPADSSFLAGSSREMNRDFHTAGPLGQASQPRNSVRARIEETLTLIGEGVVRLRLLEPAQTPNRTIPGGTILTATGKLQAGRLQLKVTSMEIGGNIVPVDITVYDLDGQQGLYVPYSPELSALSEMAGNMGQTSGTSVMLTQSPGQQVAADLSRGVVQGVSGYFSKKVRTPKVTLKAGYQVFLVSKK
ncbi:conjugative transposon protein TraM [Pedobacter sp. ASV28]|uniref:conjugative transposon protein TraM n=1 Tax=Pedobacter sp. ASV28 TaxID=2795123 RepID=UPI0018EDE6DF|nr:conjugative transposon protein TraM [Pedobacter sp. ASV28]